MGLYDNHYCDAEMPDSAVPPGSRFQTKSFLDPRLRKYRITKAGWLIDSWGRDLEVDGYVRFYPESNPLVTGSPWPEYQAHFNDGHRQARARGGGPNLRIGVVPPTAANDDDAFAVPSDQNVVAAAIDYGPRPA